MAFPKLARLISVMFYPTHRQSIQTDKAEEPSALLQVFSLFFEIKYLVNGAEFSQLKVNECLSVIPNINTIL